MGRYHYGQLHVESPSSLSGPQVLFNPKIDFFRKDILDTVLQSTNNQFPDTFKGAAAYLTQALALAVGADRTGDVWAIKSSKVLPHTHYGLEVWAQGAYDIGESLAMVMGFLERDPDHPTRTRIAAHNTLYQNTGTRQSQWQIGRLDTHHSSSEDVDFQLGGVRLKLNIPVEDLYATLGKKYFFDVGEWIQSTSPMLPFTAEVGATILALSPTRYALQVHVDTNMRFHYGVDEVLGVQAIGNDLMVMLPDLDAPIAREVLLSDADLSKCFVELDIVEPSWNGSRFRKNLYVLPLVGGEFGETVQHVPRHLEFQALAAPLRGTKELRVHLRNDRDLGIPFYTGLTGLWLHFHKHPQTMSSLVQGGKRVMLESSVQLDLYPDNQQGSFKCRLPDKGQLDHTWEVCLLQLLLPHTWRNVYRRAVGIRVHYDNATHSNVKMYLRADTYVTVQDVISSLQQVIASKAPNASLVPAATINEETGFYEWTFPTNDFSIYLSARLARTLGYLDQDTWRVPFFYRADSRHPTVEISKRDAGGQPTEAELTASHTMALQAKTNIWSQISPKRFQNIYVHCNVSEPVYVGSDMAQVIFTHGVNTTRERVEDVQIPHLQFFRLTRYEFQELHIQLRDNTGNVIPFHSGTVTVTLHFRQRGLP